MTTPYDMPEVKTKAVVDLPDGIMMQPPARVLIGDGTRVEDAHPAVSGPSHLACGQRRESKSTDHEGSGPTRAYTGPRSAIGQFMSHGAGPKPDHLISAAATRRARRRMQQLILDGSPTESLAAYKLLYGEPRKPKGNQELPPSARQAPGVAMPTPDQVAYGLTG